MRFSCSEMVLGERADALLERLAQGQFFAVSTPERDRLLARICNHALPIMALVLAIAGRPWLNL